MVFSLANLIQFLQSPAHLKGAACENMDFDLVAQQSIDKFIVRFQEMEMIMQEQGVPLTAELAKSLSLPQWFELWTKAKLRRYR